VARRGQEPRLQACAGVGQPCPPLLAARGGAITVDGGVSVEGALPFSFAARSARAGGARRDVDFAFISKKPA